MDKSRLNKMFNELKVEALVSEAPQTRLWYSNVQTTDGYIIIEPKKATLFVDGRYIEYAQNKAKNVDVKLLTATSMKEWFKERAFKSVAFESNYLTKDSENYLTKIINPKEVKWVDGQVLRIIKDKEEIETMQKVVDISLSAYDELLTWIKPGMTEKEVAAYLNYLLKKHGGDKESFDEIVAASTSSAEPHHHPTDKKLVEGELLKIDFGALYKGFCADITRTHVLGGEDKVNNPKLLEILNIVKQAAKKGRDIVKPGIKASDVDKICRDYIEAAGYGEYFVHSTGHGLGIDIHELPRASKNDHTILEEGMIITVEPGIYIEGLGGARIEDDVLVTKTGRYVFSRPDER
ncbi:aminopeptidase P family protein [Mycoplasma crocodyli]|uniref:Xaa-Pro aminopeptidase n=1 Tax=Mycoplasma crocodyli (strain ATCC 51981 / MP145) TaxID=512564 RepID=D5E4S6_MYCCM|nr:aminopeptidase P family protein [Mycoplasma crocodyli]ADE19875.1 Xaa-Pro aminopeptidase [Mycoplasma crocodyli MP145]